MKLHTEIFFQKKMAVVAPPGAVATALRHVRYQKQARSASDTRPHRAVLVDGAHRSRSLTCILTTAADAALRRSKQRLRYTYDELPPRVTGDLRGIHNRTRLRRRIDAGGPLAGPPSRPGAQTVPPCCSAVLCRGLFFVFLLFEIDFDEFKKVTQSSVPSSSSPPRLCL